MWLSVSLVHQDTKHYLTIVIKSTISIWPGGTTPVTLISPAKVGVSTAPVNTSPKNVQPLKDIDTVINSGDASNYQGQIIKWCEFPILEGKMLNILSWWQFYAMPRNIFYEKGWQKLRRETTRIFITLASWLSVPKVIKLDRWIW